MKYFTPELLDRIASSNDDIADAAQGEWEKAIVRYNRRWGIIQNKFPMPVRRFEEQGICLQDARLIRQGYQGDTFVLILETESPSRNLIIFTFVLEGEPEIKVQESLVCTETDIVTWLYEEWDLDRHGKCCFEVLFSNGSFTKLCFREFQYVIVSPVLTMLNGAANLKNGHRSSASSGRKKVQTKGA